MLTFAKQYARNDFSQFGEDGILEEIFRRLKIEKGTAVEFGAHNGIFCSNTRSKILKGWHAMLIEADEGNYNKMITAYSRPSDLAFNRPNPLLPDVTMLKQYVTVDNINPLLPRDVDLLSIDVDGIDYKLWEAWTGNAKVVVIEINSSLDPYSYLAGDPQRGRSYTAMWLLALKKGYQLICHTGNMIFIAQEYFALFPEIPGGTAPYTMMTLFFDRSHQSQPC